MEVDLICQMSFLHVSLNYPLRTSLSVNTHSTAIETLIDAIVLLFEVVFFLYRQIILLTVTPTESVPVFDDDQFKSSLQYAASLPL